MKQSPDSLRSGTGRRIFRQRKCSGGASLFGILDLDGAPQREAESEEEKGRGKMPVRLRRPSGDGL